MPELTFGRHGILIVKPSNVDSSTIFGSSQAVSAFSGKPQTLNHLLQLLKQLGPIVSKSHQLGT